METENIRAEAKEVLRELGDKSDVPWSDLDNIVAGICRGINLARQHDKQTDQQLESEYRKNRRDRFIAAALTGLMANPSEYDPVRCDEAAFARAAIEQADAVLTLLDAESGEGKS